jgi:hypothetical protein
MGVLSARCNPFTQRPAMRTMVGGVLPGGHDVIEPWRQARGRAAV